MKKYYPSVRTLHLYFGLFISPFVLTFSVSVNPTQIEPRILIQIDPLDNDCKN